MSAHIHLVVPAHLAMSPRAQREALVLRQAGYRVTIAGVWFDPQLAGFDRELARRLGVSFCPVADVRPGAAPLRRLAERGEGWWARRCFHHTGQFSAPLLGYGLRSQLRAALQADADLTIAHGEAGLWVAHELALRNRRMGVDFEDWFSRDLPESQRRTRPVDEIARLEAWLLRHAAYRTASSRAMAAALAETYDVPEPAVVTNAGQPEATDPRPRGEGPLRLIWCSQTIGPARGLEFLFTALPLVRSRVCVTLLGALRDEHRRWFNELVPTTSRECLVIEPQVAPWELPARLAEHDVGLVLETPSILSRDLCIPNKFFHYLASGLAVIATRTRGLVEAMEPCPDAGRLVENGSPRALAQAIDSFATDRVRLAAAQRAARHAGKTISNGSQERDVILAQVESALGLPAKLHAGVSPASARSIAAAARRSPSATAGAG